jgi:hypothetical protein
MWFIGLKSLDIRIEYKNKDAKKCIVSGLLLSNPFTYSILITLRWRVSAPHLYIPHLLGQVE